MNKNIVKILAAAAGCLMLASFSPSLDGRAVVADEGEFPKGLFAKTVGYLPGDSISVSNLASKESVDILVIGALDPSEGVAILLSPEAASALGIVKNSNNVVKITKRSGQLDEAVSGTAVIARGAGEAAEEASAPTETAPVPAEETPAPVETVPAAKDAPAPAETAPAPEDTPAPAETAPAVEEAPAPAETAPAVEDTPAPAESVASESIVPDELSEEQPEQIESTPAPAETPAAEETPAPVETPAAEEPQPPEAEKFAAETLAPEEQEKAPAPAAEETPAVEEISAPEPVKSVQEVSEPEKPSEEAINPDELPPEEQPKSEETKPEETAPAEEVKPVNNGPAEESIDPDELPAEEDKKPETKPVAPAVPVKPAESAYEPIILVPAQPNPPAEEKKSEPVQEKKETAKPAPVPAPVTVPAPVKEVSHEFDKYTVQSLKQLKSGCYYIQLAMYNDDANIRAFIEKYGKTYPITLVPLAAGKGRQVMVGPLNVDEYGAVLQRFKAYGFKDAFLRKIR